MNKFNRLDLLEEKISDPTIIKTKRWEIKKIKEAM